MSIYKPEQNAKNSLSDKMGKLDHMIDGAESALSEFPEKAKDFYAEAKDQSYKMIQNYSEKLDKNVHKNPWPYVAGVAVLGLTLGYIMRKK